MNFLAHAYLSFNNPDLLRGNMLGDFVKGSLRNQFSLQEQYGMDLHRYIDRFTDNHPAYLELKNKFRPAGLLGAGVFADMVFDHLLASHNDYFTETDLHRFAQSVYMQLPGQHPATPEKAKIVFDAMSKYNWFVQYRTLSGIEHTLQGMCRRYPRLGNAHLAIECLHQEYAQALSLFNQFFPEIQTNCLHFIAKIPNNHA